MTETRPPASNEPADKSQDEYAVPVQWLISLLAIPAILSAVLLGMYAWQFSRGLSHKQEAWGQFGDFIGGVLNPFVSWITLIAVAFSLRLTVHTLRETAKATRISFRQYENEIIQQGNRRLETKDSAKKERTFQMHQVWVDPGMQDIRREALAFLRSCAQPKGTEGNVYMGRYWRSNEAKEQIPYNKLRGVWEFLANINTLSDSALLDNWLLFQLFGASLEPWVALNQRVILLEQSADDDQRAREDNSWFQGSVRPLGDKLKTWKESKGIERAGWPGT